MNAFTVIWKPCVNAALISASHRRFILTTIPSSVLLKTGKLTVDELIAGKTVHLTQFGRSLHELGIDLIFAKTPQAKGRIERLWVTLQSRPLLSSQNVGLLLCQKQNRFSGNRVQGTFSIRGLPLSRKQSLSVFFCLCRKRFESGFHPLCKAHEKNRCKPSK